MQLNRGDVWGGHGCGAPDGSQLRCRERELVAQLHELLFPSTAPSAAGGASWSSSSSAAADLSVERCSSPVKALAFCGKRRGRRSKRVREGRHPQEDQKQRGGSSTATKASRGNRKKQGTRTTIVTTVPDIDGYQWKKYGQKQIEAAEYPRSYYRCTNSLNQACPAKRTVQRNDDGDGDGGKTKYTVVYISEHSCKTAEAVAAPVILETTVRTKAPDIAAVSTATQSPASSDITWSGCAVAGANPTPSERGDGSSLFAVYGDCWDWDPSPATEMDLAGPIMSPVHVATSVGSWISDLFVNESPFVLNSCQLFGF